ncbi:hypothetical protein, partial [Amycolatopsis japonica]
DSPQHAPDLTLSWNEQTPAPPQQNQPPETPEPDATPFVHQDWEPHEEQARWASRADREDSAGASESDDLVELTLTERVAHDRSPGPDAFEVDRWSVETPETVYLELSGQAKARLGAMVDRLLERTPEAAGRPWDIRLHVKDTEARLGRYGQAWFELMEKELKSALSDRGVAEDSEMLLFGFDHIAHSVEDNEGIIPGLDIIVHKPTRKTISGYRNAQSLKLAFLYRSENLLKISRRKLHWRVESLAEAAESGDQSRLAIDLRSTDSELSGHVKAVTQAVNAAVRRAYPGASKAKIKTFIDKHIEFLFSTSGNGLFVDMVNDSGSALRAGKKVYFEQASSESAKLSDADEEAIRDFGDLLGQKISARPLELPDARITVRLESDWSDKNVQRVVRNYLDGLLWTGMHRAKMTDSEIEDFAFTWFWQQGGIGQKSLVFVRTHVPVGEPEGGRNPDYYRQVKKLEGMFVNNHSAQLSKPAEQKVVLATEGFFKEFIDAAPDERPILDIEFNGHARTGRARERRMKDIVRNALTALRKGDDAVPAVEQIMGDYTQIAWNPNSTLSYAKFLVQRLGAADMAEPESVLSLDGGDGDRLSGGQASSMAWSPDSLSWIAQDVGGDAWYYQNSGSNSGTSGDTVSLPDVPGEEFDLRALDSSWADSMQIEPDPPAMPQQDRSSGKRKATGPPPVSETPTPAELSTSYAEDAALGSARLGVPDGLRQEWGAHVDQARRASRMGWEETDDLVKLTTTERPPVRSRKAGRDAVEVDGWSAKPPEAGPLGLSVEDKAGLGALVDRLLERSPVAEGKPWDIRMHVTESESRLDRYGPTWFEQMETALTEILADRGVPENSEMLLFGFDRIEHRVEDNEGILSGVDIIVHEPSVGTIRHYQNAQSLNLAFQPGGESLLKVSRRKLHWRVESLAKAVKSDAGDRSHLVLDLRTTKDKLSAHMEEVTRAVNAAARRAYPLASNTEIKAFIDKHIGFRYSTTATKYKSYLFADTTETVGGTSASPPEHVESATRPTGRESFGGERAGGEWPEDWAVQYSEEPEPNSGGVGDPVPLSDVVVGGIDLSDVDFVPLKRAGRVVGALFPLAPGEIEVVRSAIAAGAGAPDAYLMVGHGGDGGFWVRRKSDGAVVKLDAVGVNRLLDGLASQRGHPWRDMGHVVIVSCGVNNPATGGLLGKVRQLARDVAGYRGTFLGPQGRVRVWEKQSRIESLDGGRSGRPEGGVGYRGRVRFVDLATPGRDAPSLPWRGGGQSLAGPSALGDGVGSTFGGPDLPIRTGYAPDSGADLAGVVGVDGAPGSRTVPPELVQEWQSQVEWERAVSRSRAHRGESGGTSEPDGLVELTPVDRPPVRVLPHSRRTWHDAAEVETWTAGPPKAGPLGLSLDDMARLGALADSLLKRSPVADGKPWDIRLHVTDTEARIASHGQTWFEQMETALTEILIDRGVPEEMLLFGFDHLEHRMRRTVKLPGIGITAHETSAETIHDYRAAQSLDLFFQAHRAAFLKTSRRKLHWRVESLAKAVKSDAGDRSRLLLHLGTTKGKFSSHVKAVTQAVNVAVRRAYPWAFKREIKAFIDNHIEFIYEISDENRPGLLVDLVNYAEAASTTSSLQKFAQLKKGVNATFDWADLDYVRLSEDGEKEIKEFGGLLGQKILTRPPELPDGRISVNLLSGSADKKIQKSVQDHLTELLGEGMRSARVVESGARLSEPEIKGFAFTWMWGKDTKESAGRVYVRTHVAVGEPEDGRPPEYYRQAKNLAGAFVGSTSAQLSKREERRVVLATEGFVGRYNAATGEGPTLKIEIKGNPVSGQAREDRMKAVVEEVLKAVPGGEQIRRDHVLIEWNQNSTLPKRVDFSLRETVPGEETVGGPVSDTAMLDGGGMEMGGTWEERDAARPTDAAPLGGEQELSGGWQEGMVVLSDLFGLSPVEGSLMGSGYVPDSWPGFEADVVGVVGPVVASWRGGVGVDGGWSVEAEAGLAGFVEVFVRNSVLLAGQGREPLDVLLVTRGPAEVWGVWRARLEERLRAGLRDAGLARDVADSLFDWVELPGEVPGVGVVVRESPNRQVAGYAGAKTLTLSFLPGNAELTQASRRRLGWLAEGFVHRWVSGAGAKWWMVVPDGEQGVAARDVKAA